MSSDGDVGSSREEDSIVHDKNYSPNHESNESDDSNETVSDETESTEAESSENEEIPKQQKTSLGKRRRSNAPKSHSENEEEILPLVTNKKKKINKKKVRTEEDYIEIDVTAFSEKIGCSQNFGLALCEFAQASKEASVTSVSVGKILKQETNVTW
jgi:hypothetical protein